MADPDKIPETLEDTQATYDPTAEEANRQSPMLENSILSESQDFHLIDCDETQKPTQDEKHEIEKNTEVQNCPKVSSHTDKVSSTQPEVIDSKTPERMAIDRNKDDAVEPEIEKKDEKGTSDDDDDDFIQSSQQDVHSPLRKQLSNLIGGISQKRKAENTEDSLTKFPRTCSREDALSSVRKALDEVGEFLVIDTIKDTKNDDIVSNMIIQETQESCENEETSESLEQELAKTLSQLPTDDDNFKMNDLEKTPKSSPIKENMTIERLIEETETTPEKVKMTEFKKVDEKEETLEKAHDKEKTPENEKIPLNEIVSREKNDESVSSISIDLKKPEPIVDSILKDSEVDKNDITKNSAESTSTITENTKDESPLEVNTILINDKIGIETQKIDPKKPEIEKNQLTQTSSNRSRMSIEVIYDRATAPPEKKHPRELVEIDEDGEKIVLDLSQDNCDKSLENNAKEKNKMADTSYKSCDSKNSTDYKSIDSNKDSSCDYKSSHSLTNGSTESKIVDSDLTVSGARTDLFTSDSTSDKKLLQFSQNSNKKARMAATLTGKIAENPEILSISDSDESFVIDERSKLKEQTPTSSSKHDNTSTKIISIEKELSIMVKLKCLVYIDDTTKEQVEKVVTGVHCESIGNDFSSSRRRNSDTSGLADISGNENRDASPGSVTSNPNPYPLNPRFSIASVASSSSVSSAGSLNAKILANSIKFQLPRGPAKHAKKIVNDNVSTPKRLENDEILENLQKEWKNIDNVTMTLMNFASNELQTIDLHNGSTAERVDNSLERIHSSTPEIVEKIEPIVPQATTPKRTAKRGRSAKTTRAKSLRSSDANGVAKNSPTTTAAAGGTTATPTAATAATSTTNETEKVTPSTSRKRKSSPDSSTPSRQSANPTKESLNETSDDLVGKEVFAKWSDNKYYPGTVTGKTKTKYRINFYDGQNKMIIEDFIVPMPATLSPGLSVYATSSEDDYGSCGIIIDVKKNKENVVYIVETDEREKIRVDIKNIFLTNDQVQVLREETKIEMKSPPSTPKHLGKVTLDNVIDGKRRSRRVLTPVVTTPRGKRGRGSLADKTIDIAKASASGTSSSLKYEENYETTSDSSSSMINEHDFLGVQPEIIGTPSEQDTKGGTSSAIKGKGRSRKRSENPEIVAQLGPMPDSEIFRGMSFVLTCVSVDQVERFRASVTAKDSKDSSSDPGTENEEEWSKKPFVRERLVAQLSAGGGKIYENFELVPSEEYENTKLITNVPNITKKSLLCLSVGIKAYNHQWVIRCCQENKIVNPSEEELPAGWSLLKQSYVEMFQRRNEKPFQTLPVIVVIPVTPADKEFVSFWRQICENAGGSVILVETPDDGFIEGTVVLANRHCPSWVIEKASSWKIPLVSTVWIIECLIEGTICSDDAHPSFKYNYVKRSASHISSLKRR